MGGKKKIYRDVRFFHGAIQFSAAQLENWKDVSVVVSGHLLRIN